MKPKLCGKYLSTLVFIGLLLATLIVLYIFEKNIKKYGTSFKSEFYKRSQMFAGLSLRSNPPQEMFSVINTNISVNYSNPHTFAKLMKSFPWITFKKATIQDNMAGIRNYSELLLTSILIPFVTKEPSVPINTSCKAPPLPSEPSKNCVPLKNGSPPKKIGVVVNFGYDVDALEVHLHELDSLVDKFFLSEGMKIHNRIMTSKPSIWNLIKNTTRFSQFQSKIVHFIVNDADYHETALPGVWDREKLEGRLRLKKFLDWNKETCYFSANDWIGIGDTDEIPSRQTINLLKNCEIKGDEDGGVDIGIWFPFYNDDTIRRTDFPVPGHSYTLGNPTYWKVSAVKNFYEEGSGTGRRAGTGNFHLLGGMHFSAYLYTPFLLTKWITATESDLDAIRWAIEVCMSYLNGAENGRDVESEVMRKWVGPRIRKNVEVFGLKEFRRKLGDQETDDIVKRPWFYQCNPGRFPSFKGELDKRLF